MHLNISIQRRIKHHGTVIYFLENLNKTPGQIVDLVNCILGVKASNTGMGLFFKL